MDTTIFQKFYEEKTALINPTDCTKPIDNFPEVCISTFSKNIIDKFISLNSVQKIAELYTANGVNPVYKINYKGKEIAFYLSLVGASACVSGLEEIIALGAKKIILFGSCGILNDSVKDKIIIPTSAVRDEGTSYHYIPANQELSVNPEYINTLISCLDKYDCPYVTGKSWTTDGIYRETLGIINDRKAQGCITVELEFSAALAVCTFRNIPFLQFLYGADCLDNDTWDIRDLCEYGLSKAEQLMFLALECGIAL